MTFPTPYTIGWHTHSEGPVDAHENPTSVYTPELDGPGAERAVIGWGPVSVTVEPNSERVISRRKLYVPSGFASTPRDVADLPDGQWEVDGEIDDESHGFHGWKPGDVVWLKRTQQ